MKALMVRQMIGCAMLRKVRDQQERVIHKAINDLNEILEMFLPRQAELRPSLAVIIRAAVQLANQIAEEQALFRWPLSQEWVLLPGRKADKTQAEQMYLCTFPGLQRQTVEGRLVTLVEPCGEPESLLFKARLY